MFDRRKEFEAALRAEGFDSDHYFQGAYADRYDDDFTQCRWEGWNLKCESVSAKPAPVEAPDWTEGLMPMPLNPSIGMIEDGAQRLVSWEHGCKWPDSWSALQVSAARNEAERVWRSMWLNWKENSPLPAPALAVADEPVADAAKFEQLLGELRAAEYNAGESRRADPGKSGEAEAEALRAYFKQSRSPVQEGAQCVWRQESDDDAYWQTGCGHAFEFNDGGPAENSQKFCGYCGGTLVVSTPGTGGSNG